VGISGGAKQSPRLRKTIARRETHPGASRKARTTANQLKKEAFGLGCEKADAQVKGESAKRVKTRRHQNPRTSCKETPDPEREMGKSSSITGEGKIKPESRRKKKNKRGEKEKSWGGLEEDRNLFSAEEKKRAAIAVVVKGRTCRRSIFRKFIGGACPSQSQ